MPQRPPPTVPEHELLKRIGGGSFGEVWLGRHRLTGAWRAVKIVHCDPAEGIRAYERELRGIRRFEPISRTHPGLVNILQVGDNGDPGCFYYVMELADCAPAERGKAGEGEQEKAASAQAPSAPATPPPASSPATYTPRTLASDLKGVEDGQRERLPARECIELGLALADALAHLHGHGLLHRDIKPANVVFVNGKPRLADIGLVASFREAGSFVGTRGFVPPEGPVDARGDLYSLGKVLYECAWGKDRLEFPGVPAAAADWSDHGTLLELNEVILKACDPNPERRYASAREMQEELSRLHQGRSIRHARGVERRLRRWMRAGVAVSLLAALACGGWLYQRHQSERFKQLADENRRQVSRQQVANGVRLMEEGDLLASLPWFVKALRTDQGDAEREAMHRYRIEAVLRHCPKLVAWGAHSNRINYAEVSRDGKRLVTAAADGTAQLWNAVTGEPVGPPLRHGGDIPWAWFSPDGTRLVTLSDDTEARIWDVNTGALAFTPLRHSNTLQHAAFSPAGDRLVTASDDGMARVWNATNGLPIGQPLRHEKAVVTAEFSGDGRWVVTGGKDGVARVWDAASSAPVSPALVHPQELRHAAFSPEGRRIVTACMDGAARIWNIETGQITAPPVRHHARARRVVFSRDGRRVVSTGGLFGTIGEALIWDAHSGEVLLPPLLHAAPVWAAQFTPDDRWILTESSDGTARLWDAASGERIGALFRQHDSIRNASLHPNGRQVLTSGRDGIWRLWDLANAASCSLSIRFTSIVRHAEFSPDGRRLLTVAESSGVMVWDAATGEAITPQLRDAGAFHLGNFSPDGRLIAAAGRDGQARIVDAFDGAPVSPWLHHEAAITCLAFSPDGRRLATGSADQTVRLWDARTGEALSLAMPHAFPVRSLAFSPAGGVLATGSGVGGAESFAVGPGELRLWTVSSGTLAAPPVPLEAAAGQVAFSPDGKRLAVACADLASGTRPGRLLEVVSPHGNGALLTHGGDVVAVGFSPDGQWVATGSKDGTARVWEATTGRPVTPVLRHQRGVQSLSFSPDSRRLLTAGPDGTARIWDARTGEAITPALKHGPVKRSAREGFLRGASFHPDNIRVLTVGGSSVTNAEVRIWELPACSLKLREIEQETTLLAGAKLDDTAEPVPLAVSTLQDLWRGVRSQPSALFASTPNQALAWHRAQADECEQHGEWFAARFHLKQLAMLAPSNTAFAERLRRVEALVSSPNGEGLPDQPGP